MASFELVESAGVQGGEIEWRGAKGSLVVSQDGYRINPAKAGQSQTWKQLIGPEEERLKGEQTYGDQKIREDNTAVLVCDFLDCIRTRRPPLATLEDGHRSTTFAHLANTALKLGQELHWDPDAERFANC